MGRKFDNFQITLFTLTGIAMVYSLFAAHDFAIGYILRYCLLLILALLLLVFVGGPIFMTMGLGYVYPKSIETAGGRWQFWKRNFPKACKLFWTKEGLYFWLGKREEPP